MKDDGIVTIHVGKNGITPALTEEIRSVLRKRKTVKVKMLKSAFGEQDKNQLAEVIRESCRARRAHLIGHILTLEQ